MQPFDDLQFFEYEQKNQLNAENKNYLRLHYLTASLLIDRYEEKFHKKPKTILELGSGMGTCLEKLLMMGYAATGIDKSQYHKNYFDSRNPQWAEHYILGDFTQRNLLHYDIIFSIEVFEHISDSDLQPIYAQLANSCDMFLFSSTPFPSSIEGFDKQWGHINIKSEQEWIKLFMNYGFSNIISLEKLPTEWTKIFYSKQVYGNR